MTQAIGNSAAETARTLAAEKTQASQRSAAASEPATGSRTTAGGDSIRLSEAAQAILGLQGEKAVELKAIPLDRLKLITPEGQRSEAETGIRQMMTELGIEGDLEFSIQVNDDGTIAVESGAPAAAETNGEIEAAIKADPVLQKTLREMRMTSKFAYEGPAIKAAIEAARTNEDGLFNQDLFGSARAARERTEAAGYTFTMTAGGLSTAFVGPSGERFGGVSAPA